ncbi:sarcosine oxidase subunit gamma [Phycobacter sp. K97]|uniref:sarcosine oxidase subunit gamma n=1 Tax=Phycobacter sedimenti TaxID=3133977 RepID=UPI00311DB278
MTDLTPITALGMAEAARVSHGALIFAENPDIALASLTLRKGVTPPQGLPEVGEFKDGAFWIGPNQWMLEGPGQAETDFAARVQGDLPGCSITEQTDGFWVVEVTSVKGAAPLEDLMAKLVNIDPAAFATGQAIRTGLHHMTVFLVRRRDDHMAIIGMRSYAGALWHALNRAAHRLAMTSP